MKISDGHTPTPLLGNVEGLLLEERTEKMARLSDFASGKRVCLAIQGSRMVKLIRTVTYLPLIGQEIATMSDYMAWETSRTEPFETIVVEAAHDHKRKLRQQVRPVTSDRELAEKLQYEEEFPSLPAAERKSVPKEGSACTVPPFPISAIGSPQCVFHPNHPINRYTSPRIPQRMP